MLVSVLGVYLADLVEIPDHLARHIWATPLAPTGTPCPLPPLTSPDSEVKSRECIWANAFSELFWLMALFSLSHLHSWAPQHPRGGRRLWQRAAASEAPQRWHLHISTQTACKAGLGFWASLPHSQLSLCERAPAQPGHHLEVQSISLLCWMTRGGKQEVPVQSEAPVQCGCSGVSTPQTRMHRRSEVISHLCWGPALSSHSQHTEACKPASAHTAVRYPHLPETKQTGLSPGSPSFFLFKTKSWKFPSNRTESYCPCILGIFPTQGSNPGLPHCRWIQHSLSHQGSPCSSYKFLSKTQGHSQHPREQMPWCPMTRMRLLTKKKIWPVKYSPEGVTLVYSSQLVPPTTWGVYAYYPQQQNDRESVRLSLLGLGRILLNRRPCWNQSPTKLLSSSFNQWYWSIIRDRRQRGRRLTFIN